MAGGVERGSEASSRTGSPGAGDDVEDAETAGLVSSSTSGVLEASEKRSRKVDDSFRTTVLVFLLVLVDRPAADEGGGVVVSARDGMVSM